MRNIKTNNSTQTQIVLDHFHKQGSISGLEAMALYRVTSLTKVISVIRAKGYEVVSLWKSDNTGKRYKRYFSIGQHKSTPNASAFASLGQSQPAPSIH